MMMRGWTTRTTALVAHHHWKRARRQTRWSTAVVDHGTKFADRARVRVHGGRGGQGNNAFEPIPGARKGSAKRASGGSGGRGGNVVVVASNSVASLYRQHGSVVRAERGENGRRDRQKGATGADFEYKVPPGTVVRVRPDSEDLEDVSEEVLFEHHLMVPGERAVVARGGRGSKGNAARSTAANKALARRKLKGASFGHVAAEPGEARLLDLELRTIADVGLVGKPNAGKSSLLRAVSAATPEVADYPFTTIRPHVGVCEFKRRSETGAAVDIDTLRFADVPGLIEGAADGKGLGLDFLRHVFRSRALVFLADASRGLDAFLDDVRVVHAEISHSPFQGWDGADGDDDNDAGEDDAEETHDDSRVVPARIPPSILFANKADLLPPSEFQELLARARLELADLGFLDVFGGSAATGQGVPALATRLRRLIRVEMVTT